MGPNKAVDEVITNQWLKLINDGYALTKNGFCSQNLGDFMGKNLSPLFDPTFTIKLNSWSLSNCQSAATYILSKKVVGNRLNFVKWL